MPNPPPMLKNSNWCLCRQFLHERQYLLHRQLERLHLGELRADVHLHSAQTQIFQFPGPGIHSLHFLKGDPELVFVSAGSDLGVGAGIDVRVHADGYRRLLF